jgi:hypothetical protein
LPNFLKDDKNAATNIQLRWIAIAESEMGGLEKYIHSIFEEYLIPEIDYQKNEFEKLEFLKSDSLVQFQLKELANLLELDPGYVYQVLQDSLKGEINSECISSATSRTRVA